MYYPDICPQMLRKTTRSLTDNSVPTEIRKNASEIEVRRATALPTCFVMQLSFSTFCSQRRILSKICPNRYLNPQNESNYLKWKYFYKFSVCVWNQISTELVI
jgi:hypothetical protein